MLTDVDRNLSLSDSDRGMKTGEKIAVLTEPVPLAALLLALKHLKNNDRVVVEGVCGFVRW